METLIIGHRGAGALEPENTLLSLAKGIECGANLVEVDARTSKDGHLVVIHDRTLERTTSGKGLVKDFTLQELKSLDAGRGERIPTLEEVLNFTKGVNAKLIIEIKEEGTEDAIARGVGNSGLEDSVILISFNPKSVRRVKELLPKVKTGFIFPRPLKNPVGLALGLHSDVLLPQHGLVTAKLVDSSHKHGIKVFSWTLNSTEEFRSAVKLGLDGFATDNPCLARQVIG